MITSSKKNHETQFLTNLISNDEILKKSILKKIPKVKKIEIKRIKIKFKKKTKTK